MDGNPISIWHAPCQSQTNVLINRYERINQIFNPLRGSLFGGRCALPYFFLMIPPTGGAGPAFATTHSMLAARDDCSPVSRMLWTVR